MVNNTNTTGTCHFEIIFKDRPLNYFAISFDILSIFGFCFLTYGILWFEHFGSDLKRILTNRLVSSICLCLLEMLVLLDIPGLVNYFYGPFPEWVCYMQIIYRHAATLRLMLIFNAIIISRYIFIFWLKNPLNFDDEFWCRFINASISFLR